MVEDRQEALRLLCVCAINVRNSSFGHSAANGNGMGHVLHGMVSGIAGLPGNLKVSIFSADWRTYGCAHDWPSALDCIAVASARTMARLANSILKPLYLCATADFMAASAAAWKVFSSAAAPVSTCSASTDRHGLVATPPKTKRAEWILLPCSSSAAPAEASANSYEARSRNFT